MSEITVIINTYKRQYSLENQINAIKNQTVKPQKIMIWHNGNSEVPSIQVPSQHKDVTVVQSSENFMYHGRFAFAFLAKTEYVCIYDDDTVSGNKWFENCLNTIKTHPGIMGTAGAYLIGPFYENYKKTGWNAYQQGGHHKVNENQIQEVDLVGHSWFFRREYLINLWKEYPLSWINAEDVQFSALNQIHGGIKTYVPPHPTSDMSMWGSLPQHGYNYGNDNASSWRLGHLYERQRTEVITGLISKGWKPCYTRNIPFVP